MKVYLDDVRDCPEGWELARTVADAVEMLRTKRVTHISLDYDLGYLMRTADCCPVIIAAPSDEINGAHLMRYIRDFHGRIFPLPHIYFHTANPAGLKIMEAILMDIKRGLGANRQKVES